MFDFDFDFDCIYMAGENISYCTLTEVSYTWDSHFQPLTVGETINIGIPGVAHFKRLLRPMLLQPGASLRGAERAN